MRKIIFERLGVPPVNDDPRKQRVFSAGHIFHSWIQGITQASGLSIAQETELQDEHFKIRGHIDDLILIDDHLILYDYKTAHSKWFEYVKDQPMNYYNKMQLGTYMYMLKHYKNPTHDDKLGYNPETTSYDLLKPQGISEARILKISKDDLRMHEQQLMWSDQLEQAIIDYWTEVNKYWKAHKMPECTCALYEVNKKTGIGFMADPRYNPYFYHDEPCSLDWYNEWLLEKKLAEGKAI
jgi:hypothetical protein